MCKLCDEGQPQDHAASRHGSRRDFLKGSTATAVVAAGMNFLSASPTAAELGLGPPKDGGAARRRYVIRGGYVMSMDPGVGDFAPGDVLVEGTKILAVGPNLKPGRRGVIDATRPHRDAGLHRHAPPSVRDRAAQLPRQRHPDQRRLGLAERGSYLLRIHSAANSRPCTGRRTCTSTSSSAAWRNSTPASPRCTTSRRSITRPSTPTRPSRRCSIRAAAPLSATSRAPAASPGTSIRRTRPASSSSGSRRAISSST